MVDTNAPVTSVQIPEAIEHAIEAQQRRLFDAEALIEVTIAALRQQFGTEWPENVPMFDRALSQALALLRSIAGDLESENLLQAAAKESADE